MAKHNSKEPKFRCNFCKEYHYVPEYKTMYQCATHGYLCEKVIVTNESKIKIKVIDVFDDFIERKASYPIKYIQYCNLEGDKDFKYIRNQILIDKFIKKIYGFCKKSTDQEIIEFWWNRPIIPKKNQPNTYGCKKTIKFNWSDELNLWIEEGNENVSLDKKPIQSLKNSNSNTEIKLLLDLYEKNILTKEQFVAQLKEKL
jgi:hypothetical protein